MKRMQVFFVLFFVFFFTVPVFAVNEKYQSECESASAYTASLSDTSVWAGNSAWKSSSGLTVSFTEGEAKTGIVPWSKGKLLLDTKTTYTVTDIGTGKRFKIQGYCVGNHFDVETFTVLDTDVVQSIVGDKVFHKDKGENKKGNIDWGYHAVILEGGKLPFPIAASMTYAPHAGLDSNVSTLPLDYVDSLMRYAGGPNMESIHNNKMDGHMDLYFSDCRRHVDGQRDWGHQRQIATVSGAYLSSGGFVSGRAVSYTGTTAELYSGGWLEDLEGIGGSDFRPSGDVVLVNGEEYIIRYAVDFDRINATLSYEQLTVRLGYVGAIVMGLGVLFFTYGQVLLVAYFLDYLVGLRLLGVVSFGGLRVARAAEMRGYATEGGSRVVRYITPIQVLLLYGACVGVGAVLMTGWIYALISWLYYFVQGFLF